MSIEARDQSTGKNKKKKKKKGRRKKEEREKETEQLDHRGHKDHNYDGDDKILSFVSPEMGLTTLLEESGAELLKEILIQHSKDYRQSMLSCVEGLYIFVLLNKLLNDFLFIVILFFFPESTDTLRKHREKHSHLRDAFKARAWNEELQSLLKQGIIGLDPENVRKLNKLCHDFADCAERYAKYETHNYTTPHTHKILMKYTIHIES